MPDFGPPDELFHGTAWFYARYRPPYAEPVLDAITAQFPVEGRSVIDLGCGTGQVALPLAKRGAKVWAVDPSQEMLDQGRADAAQENVNGIEWLRGSDLEFETLLPAQPFDLCTIGGAFHWMDRKRVVDVLDGFMAPDGGIVIVSNSIRTWTDDADWARVCRQVIVEFLGEERRAGSGTYADPPERHEAFLERSAFEKVETRYFTSPLTLDIEDIIGLQLSYSYASPALLGDRMDAFCETLRGRLKKLAPSGTIDWEMTCELITATRAGLPYNARDR